MIEITCTKTEKQRLIALMKNMQGIKDATCLFLRAANFCLTNHDASRKNCVKTRIKWNIVSNKKAGETHAGP